MRSLAPWAALSALVALPVNWGCVPRFVVRPATRDGMRPILENAINRFAAEPDWEVAQAALASNIKLIESVASAYPEDRSFLTLVAMARANYAFAFIVDDLEAIRLLDPGDRVRSDALVRRAVANYRVGEAYASEALRQNEAFCAVAGDQPMDGLDLDVFQRALLALEVDDAPALFWLAFNWGGRLQVTLDAADATQLPKIEAMAARVLALDEGFFFGLGPHLLAGMLDGFRAPAIGGNPKKAAHHFARAVELGEGALLPRAFLAQFVFAQTDAQSEFESTLHEIILAPSRPDRILLDTLAKRKACRLLANLDQFFLADPVPLPAACDAISHAHPWRNGSN